MNTFIRDKKTGDVYHVDLYEKWWYSFFLCFAAFLPQHGTKVYESEFKELHQYNVRKVKEGQTKNLILGIFISSVVASSLPKGVIYTVGEEYKFFLYFFTYLCLVLGTYLFTVHSKKSKYGQKMALVLSNEKKIVQFTMINLSKKRKWYFLMLVLFLSMCFLVLATEVITAEVFLIKVGCIFYIFPLFSHIVVPCCLYKDKEMNRYEGVLIGKEA